MRCVLDSVTHNRSTIGRKSRTAKAARLVVNMFLGTGLGVVSSGSLTQYRFTVGTVNLLFTFVHTTSR